MWQVFYSDMHADNDMHSYKKEPFWFNKIKPSIYLHGITMSETKYIIN